MVAKASKKPSPLEVRNADFWRKQSKENSEALAWTQAALAEVAGLMDRKPTPPVWALPRAGARRRAAGLLHLSDIQAGEVTSAVEVNGRNAFDIAICRRRLRRLFAATIEILPRWSSDCKLEGVVVAANGDLISGDIHAELKETNELVSLDQVEFVVDELIAGFEHLANAFGKVTAYFTPGNHGRQTIKSHAKQTAALNYDTLIGRQIARHFANDKRVTVFVSMTRDCRYQIFDWRVMQTHHDQGGGGGQGFAGSVLPIIRKAKKIEHMSAQTRDFYDILLTGHYHTSTHPTHGHFGNGSVAGYGEFAQSIRADPEPPMQWLLLVTERWGVRERDALVLDKLGGWS